MTTTLRSPTLPVIFTSLVAAALSCGGGKTSEAGGAGGQTGGPGESSGDGTEGGGGEGTTPSGDAGATTTVPPDAAPPAALITFVVKNSHTEELAFNMNKGWGANISIFSGKPPKAKVLPAFPDFCTMSCETAETERCPLCEEPETAKEKIAAQKYEKVAPGAELEIPWDGNALVYQKTTGTRNGKPKKCKCYTSEPAPAAEYTVRIVGLRLTKEVGKDSRLQSVDVPITLPVTSPVRIDVDFPAPPAPPKKKK